MQEGGTEEWEAVKRIAIKAKSPSQGLSAMQAMGASKDLSLAEATFQFIMTEARDQDTFYYAGGLMRNPATRRFLATKFKENFPAVSRRVIVPVMQKTYIGVCSSRNVMRGISDSFAGPRCVLSGRVVAGNSILIVHRPPSAGSRLTRTTRRLLHSLR